MKSILLPALLLLGTFISVAQSKTAVSLNSATIFLNGAELASTARVSLPAGESDVVFTNVAGNVNAQSLTIGAGAGVVVQSATFQNNYLGDSAISPRAKIFRDSIALLTDAAGLLEDRQAVIEEQLTVLKENRKVAGANTSLSVAELQKLLDVVSTRTTALLAEQRVITRKPESIQKRLSLLNAQIDQEQRSTYTPGGRLLVRFYTPSATTTAVSLTYVVPNAGWTPSYDLRADGVGGPVHLFYKASVFQNCGIRWNNVKVTLSTGNPAEGVEAPVLSPQYLALYSPYAGKVAADRSNSIQLNRTQMYQNVAPPTASRAFKKPLIEPEADAGPTSVNDYTAVDASGINTTFDIELPYTIPSDGQQHTVAIKTYDLPATYRHFAVPRMDKDAFLQAQITHWEDLNLLPAATSVFFEGTYVGQGFLDMRNVRDTMNLSLGRDKKIVIRRERNRTFHSTKTIGTNERQEYAYTISIRNTRKESVRLVVLDQIPVSNDKDIVIEDPQSEGADYEEATGAVKWTLDVAPAALRKLGLSYSVKYPKGKIVSGVN